MNTREVYEMGRSILIKQARALKVPAAEALPAKHNGAIINGKDVKPISNTNGRLWRFGTKTQIQTYWEDLAKSGFSFVAFVYLNGDRIYLATVEEAKSFGEKVFQAHLTEDMIPVNWRLSKERFSELGIITA
jgi:hypothetical protein